MKRMAIFKYIYKEKKYFLEFLILTPLRAASSVAVASVIASIIDFAMDGSLEQLPKYFFLFAGYILLFFLINVSDAKVHFNLIQSCITKLKQNIFDHVMHQKKGEFSQNSSKYLSILEKDVNNIREVIYTSMDMIEDFTRMFYYDSCVLLQLADRGVSDNHFISAGACSCPVWQEA
jgi:ABC-type siderophore export system fused ATPase/permease subunit